MIGPLGPVVDNTTSKMIQESFFARIAKEAGTTPIVRENQSRAKSLQKKSSVQRLPPSEARSEPISESTPEEHEAHREPTHRSHTESIRSATAAARTAKVQDDHEDASTSGSKPAPQKQHTEKGKQDAGTPGEGDEENSPEESGTSSGALPEVRTSHRWTRPKLPEPSPNADIHTGPSFCPTFTVSISSDFMFIVITC